AAVAKPEAVETAPRAAAPAVVMPVETVAAAQETIETVMKAGSQAAAKGYEQAFALAQEQVEKAQQTLFKRYDEAASFGKDNVDACVQSGTLFAKGVESLSKELMTLAQSTAEANVATAQALFGARTLREVIDLQTEFSRTRFDSLVAESAKLTEFGIALAHETVEPIQARLNATVEKLIKPIAA
ncbi:MAG: phasin family protein, partial [Bacteroidota bacterium]